MKTNIIINTTFEGLHCWIDCPEYHSESYLKNPHRHIFHIQMKFPVDHNDRDIEFIQRKNEINRTIQHNFKIKHLPTSRIICDMANMSCEDIAEWLLNQFPYAVYCRVLEDGENGAEITNE